MKSDRPFQLFTKAMAAFMAFCLGFLATMLVCAGFVSQWVETGDSFWSWLFELGAGLLVLLAVSGLGGIAAAIVSLCFPPTLTLRIVRGVMGLFFLVMGIVLVLGNANSLARFLCGPVVFGAGVYEVWTGLFGTRSQVEGP